MFLLYRVMIASVVGFLIAMFLIGLKQKFDHVLGLSEDHSAEEIVLSFVARGLVMLIYKDRLDTKQGG